MSATSGDGAGPGEEAEDDEGTSGNVGALAAAGEGIEKADEGCGGSCSCASCASARARSTRVIEFLSRTRLRSVSPSRGRSEGEVWSLRRERFESQAVVSMLWNMDGNWCWLCGDDGMGCGKAGGAVTGLPSLVASVSVGDVLNDKRVWWTVAVGDEDEGQAPEGGRQGMDDDMLPWVVFVVVIISPRSRSY